MLYIHQKEEGKSKEQNSNPQEIRCEYNSHEKVVNLLVITDGKNRHYTAIKRLSRPLSRKNRVKRFQQYY